MKEMTLKEKVELLDKIREDYSIGNSSNEELEKRFDELRLADVDYIYDKEHEHGKLFVCPDLEWELPDVYEIASEFMDEAIDIIYEAICLYYKESFWDEIAGIATEELIKIYTRLNNIPIIRYFSTSDVELLNVRKLNNDVR